MEILKRSELARRCGINIETLRYYEKRKLLDAPRRSDSGYRLYPEEDVIKIRFIKNAQKLGFTLKEIKDLLKLRVEKDERCDSALSRAQIKLTEVEKKMTGLRALRKVLKQLITQCKQNAPTSPCPILASFESKL